MERMLAESGSNLEHPLQQTTLKSWVISTPLTRASEAANHHFSITFYLYHGSFKRLFYPYFNFIVIAFATVVFDPCNCDVTIM